MVNGEWRMANGEWVFFLGWGGKLIAETVLDCRCAAYCVAAVVAAVVARWGAAWLVLIESDD
jgi:hypothetical protein